MNLRFGCCEILILSIGLFLASKPAQCATGPKVLEGEQSVGELPIELAILRYQKPIDPRLDLPGFRSGVVPVLKYLKKTVPIFERKMELVLKKHWYLVSVPLRDCNKWENLLDLSTTTRSCQDSSSVYVDEKWIMKDSIDPQTHEKVTAKLKQEFTIVHAMVSNLMAQDSPTTRENITNLVNLLLGYEGVRPSATDLQRHLEQLGFGYFRTRHQIREAAQARQDLSEAQDRIKQRLHEVAHRCDRLVNHALSSKNLRLRREAQNCLETAAHSPALESTIARSRPKDSTDPLWQINQQKAVLVRIDLYSKLARLSKTH